MKLINFETLHSNDLALHSLIWIGVPKFQDIASRTKLIILSKMWHLLSNLCGGMNEMY